MAWTRVWVDAKRKKYLAWGVSLASVETYSPAIIPDLVLALRAMFAKLDFDVLDVERT